MKKRIIILGIVLILISGFFVFRSEQKIRHDKYSYYTGSDSWGYYVEVKFNDKIDRDFIYSLADVSYDISRVNENKFNENKWRWYSRNENALEKLTSRLKTHFNEKSN